MELNAYEKKALREISKWERNKHEGFHKKILDITSKPVDYVFKKIGPDRLRKVEGVVEKTVRTLLFASTFVVNSRELIDRAKKKGIILKSIDELKKCDLKMLDECNKEHINFHEKTAAVQGAILGLGGILTATADLTTLIVEDFHMIQEIAFCYGYDPNDLIEKEIILRIIEAAIGGSEMKFRALKEIDELKKIKKRRRKAKVQKKGVSILGAKALEETVENIAVALLIRLLPRTLPVISIAVSAHSNHEIIEHTGNTSFMVYRKRFIARKRDL